jgi:hypothetical protein
MSLFSECYSEQVPSGTDCAQSGCGLANIGSLAIDPFVSEIKKGILSASKSVLKQLQRKQAGAGVRKRKKKGQKGGAKPKKQTGSGKRVQKGKGVHKRVLKKVQKGKGVKTCRSPRKLNQAGDRPRRR